MNWGCEMPRHLSKPAVTRWEIGPFVFDVGHQGTGLGVKAKDTRTGRWRWIAKGLETDSGAEHEILLFLENGAEV